MESDDDKDISLKDLRLKHESSIISQLVDIGNNCNQQSHTKFLPFISKLQCLQLRGTQLRRRVINASQEQQYVALSYTWEASDYEDPHAGRYRVQGWDTKSLTSSSVRNCVLDRIINYMRHANLRVLWIDAHCIHQDTCRDPYCTIHKKCIQKRDGLQAMDLVYQLSKHPVALLARPVQRASELELLKRILSGKLVHDGHHHRLVRATNFSEAKEALRLLREITLDRWWRRAWTFQENYRGGQRMLLLIQHHKSLEHRKNHKIFNNIQGELCVRSTTFCTEATRLCMALRNEKRLSQDDVARIDGVLRAAGRYKAILPESTAMSSTIIADIESRGLLKPWDRIAIVANCCQYSVRLDAAALRGRRHSLSLSVLAMCLLNGEIFDNNDGNQELLGPLTTSKLLERQLFKGFSAPEDDNRRLTFYKGCRLTDVKLTQDGCLTKGHLWKLGHVVDTSEFRRKLPWIKDPNGRLTPTQRKHLLKLVLHLKGLKYESLADEIDMYLARDAVAAGNKDFGSFTEEYLHLMASELAAAIQTRKKLRLGSIWDSTGRSSPYRAVFVWPGQDKGEGKPQPSPAFVFTSAWFRQPGSLTHDANDIDRHVSLQVNLEGATSSSGVPRLHVQGWLLGVCFFHRQQRTEVLFPWPQALLTV